MNCSWDTIMSHHSFIAAYSILAAGLLGSGLSFAQEIADKPAAATDPQLKTLEEQAAYAIGLDLGRDVLSNAPDIDPTLVARGVIDAMRKGKTLLSTEKANAALDEFMAKKIGPAAEKNCKEGQTFLAENKTKQGVQTTESGLQYFVTRPGTGKSPKETDVVRVNYTGMLLDGKVFDTTNGKEPAEFPVNRVVPGWTEALQKMKVGEKWRLYVPSRLAYGPQGTPGGPIPPFATLIFDVELLDILQ
jgi:FKBP-type peptidyl-prolyl cis-trans isomerase